MGGCLSKKKDALEKKQIKKEKQQREENQQSPERSKNRKKQVFAIARACNATSSGDAGAGKEQDTTKREDAPERPPAADEQRTFPVRTSSCTKEEVDAILIQCGRLSRSSSGKQTSEETDGAARRRSGAKRSYDFDERPRAHEEDEGDWGRPASRVSPRRRTRDRSGSRERIGGGRRASRSPARRVPQDSPQFDKLNQPVKMVSVPPREKGAGGSVEAKAASTQTMAQSSSSLVAGRRGGASPRSRSPVNPADADIDGRRAPQHSSRSSGRSTADNSPFGRNPMAEIDENLLGRERRLPSRSKTHKLREAEEASAMKQVSLSLVPSSSQKSNETIDAEAPTGIKTSSRPPHEDPEIVEEAAAELKVSSFATATQFVPPNRTAAMARTTSTRSSTRDLDKNPILNEHEGGGSKASSTKTREPFMESEIFSGDGEGLVDPSLHKFVAKISNSLGKGETEPQESAGSNSFVAGGNCGSWAAAVSSPEPCNSTDSANRSLTSRSNVGRDHTGDAEQRRGRQRRPEKPPPSESRRGSGASGGGSYSGKSSSNHLGAATMKKKKASSSAAY